MMCVATTGAKGQVATALSERAGPEFEILTLSRRAFSLEARESVLAEVRAARPDLVINAAAYTVDRAESELDLATRVTGEGVGSVAEAGVEMGAPLLHLSTDDVFDGTLHRPYGEDDPTGPTGADGRSKLAGAERIANICSHSAILRTAWVYRRFGPNVARTMLRLNETRDGVGVVADRHGNPTSAPDIVEALLVIARRMRDNLSRALRGIFHMDGSGERNWADFAGATFHEARFRRLTTADYPTPARRPANSRLDNEKLRLAYGVALPPWRVSLAACCARLIQ